METPRKPSPFLLYSLVGVVTILAVAGGVTYYNARAKRITADAPNTPASQAGFEVAASVPSGDYSWSTAEKGPYKDSVGYATSSDLLSWKDSGVVLAEHASVPDVVLRDGILYMYFVDTTTNGYPEQLGTMRSTDNGKTWTERQFVKIEGKSVKNLIPVDPDPVLLPNGSIRLYYFDIAAERGKNRNTSHKIYSATSSDGVTFTQDDGIRFEEEGIYDPDILRVGDSWMMYVGKSETQEVVVATSQDGLTFTRHGVAYTGSTVPNVVLEDGTYYLYTAGIQIASSKDGKSFTKTGRMFSIKSGGVADPGVVKLGEDTYFMLYKISGQLAGMQPPVQPATGQLPPVSQPVK